MSRIAIPDRFDYENEHRPPRRTEHEHVEEQNGVLVPLEIGFCPIGFHCKWLTVNNLF
jgi:hypothetical protein